MDKSAEHGALRHLTRGILYDKDTFCLPQQECRSERKVKDNRAVPNLVRRHVPDFYVLLQVNY